MLKPDTEQQERIRQACLMARLKSSVTGAFLGEVLADYTEQAFSQFVQYAGDSPEELWRLRQRWKAREDYQHELLAVMDAKIDDLEAVAEELGIPAEQLELRSLIEDVGNEES